MGVLNKGVTWGRWAALALASCSTTPAMLDAGSEAPVTPDGGSISAAPDAGDANGGTAAPECAPDTCPSPGIGVACCTAPGTGEPGDILSPVGRRAGLCGANLGALAESLADVCVQLNQPGAPDPACPAQARLSGGPSMAGCCTDEGFCGSLDTLAPFGCFYATGMRGVACGAAVAPDPDGDGGA